MIQMARWPSNPREKAIYEPSGDHAGNSLFSVIWVSVRSRPPSRSITPICTGPAESIEKEMRELSGDHDGYSASERVRRCSVEPSVAMLQRFRAPARVEAKAMLLPSGDQAGDQSLALLRVRFAACEPSALIAQISSSRLMPCLESRYAIRRPSGEKLGSNCGPAVEVRRRSREPSAAARRTSRSSGLENASVPEGVERAPPEPPSHSAAPAAISPPASVRARTRFAVTISPSGGWLADRMAWADADRVVTRQTPMAVARVLRVAERGTSMIVGTPTCRSAPTVRYGFGELAGVVVGVADAAASSRCVAGDSRRGKLD